MDLLYPAAEALITLRQDVTAILAALPVVTNVLCFGSMARGAWDRWSDIDLIAVIATQGHFLDVLTALEAAKPILHRNHFVATAAPAGGHVLGIIFQGASVFHCVDLNLLTANDYADETAIARFGPMIPLYAAHHPERAPSSTTDTAPASEVEDVVEAQLKVGLHFTKKAAKRVLRGQPAHADLERYAAQLRQSMRTHPPDLVINGRQIGALVQTYLTIAERLLSQRE